MGDTYDSEPVNADKLNSKLINGRRPPNRNNALSQIITSVGNFSVQYNFQAIAVALILMSASECTSSEEDCKEGTQAAWVKGTATATVFVGAIVGQLVMGYAGDVLGRTRAMTLTLSLVVFSSFLSAIAPAGSATEVYITIIVFRFLLGIGVGGIYPLSATKAAEDAGDGDGSVDSTSASKAFFWQTPGAATPWLIGYIITYSTGLSTGIKWRLLLGLGAVPAVVVVICSLLESQEKKHLVEEHLIRPSGKYNAPPGKNQSDLMTALRNPEILQGLIATGGGWFLYDVAYYGVNLFGGEIVSAISSTDDDNVSDNLSVRTVTQQQLIGLCTGIPAVLLTIYVLRFFSTKSVQIVGFLFIAFCFTLLASLFDYLGDTDQNDLLYVLYCVLLFSLSFGPNVTTYILPAETFPKEVRASLNGIAAACGKVGAFTGVYMFGPMADSTSYPTVMAFCAFLSLLGAALSYYYIGNNAKPYHRLSDQNILTLNQYDGEDMDDSTHI